MLRVWPARWTDVRSQKSAALLNPKRNVDADGLSIGSDTNFHLLQEQCDYSERRADTASRSIGFHSFLYEVKESG